MWGVNKDNILMIEVELTLLSSKISTVKIESLNW